MQSLNILFWGALIIIVVGLAISGFIYGIYYTTSEEAHSHLFRTDGVPPTGTETIGVICTLWVGGILIMIIHYGWLKLWDKIKNKPIAHCPIKKEEDETHE